MFNLIQRQNFGTLGQDDWRKSLEKFVGYVVNQYHL